MERGGREKQEQQQHPERDGEGEGEGESKSERLPGGLTCMEGYFQTKIWFRL